MKSISFKLIFLLIAVCILYSCGKLSDEALTESESVLIVSPTLERLVRTELSRQGRLTRDDYLLVKDLVINFTLDNDDLIGIGYLRGLTRLTLKHGVYQEFSSLPPEIGNLINLEYLEIRNSNLKSLPPEIGDLVNLKYAISGLPKGP